MWRLKIGEGGGPWLLSGSNFLGRQVWEFDPDAGTPDERAEVERLRQAFSQHRSEKRVSHDLFVRMQVKCVLCDLKDLIEILLLASTVKFYHCYFILCTYTAVWRTKPSSGRSVYQAHHECTSHRRCNTNVAEASPESTCCTAS